MYVFSAIKMDKECKNENKEKEVVKISCWIGPTIILPYYSIGDAFDSWVNTQLILWNASNHSYLGIKIKATHTEPYICSLFISLSNNKQVTKKCNHISL